MKIACVILAGGMGARMKSALPKVLHPLCGKPMLQFVMDAAFGIRPETVVVVAGRHMQEIRAAVAGPAALKFALQPEPLGTGHALGCALQELGGFGGTVLVLNGDVPLIEAGTLKKFASAHAKSRNALSVLSFEASVPAGYGRIVRNSSGRLDGIVEEKDADETVRKIAEVNSGVYLFGGDALSLVRDIKMNRAKGEYYLTDVAAAAGRAGLGAEAFMIGREDEFMGINTRAELFRATAAMRDRIRTKWTAKGVVFSDPATVYMDADVRIGADTLVYPNVCIEGKTSIGRGSVIYPNVRIVDGVVGDCAVIKDSSVIEGSIIRSGASVGPFAHIRPGSDVGRDAKIGNFVELKKALIGPGVKASHLSYLGDAEIGRDSNIGAGTITCNYDGVNKHKTVIGEGVFVGSDTQLVAPVRIGKGAYIGAGSTITRDVSAGALAVSRTPQKNVEGWAAKRKKKS